MAGLRIRLDFDSGARIGPAKIRLLELVDELGSISAAAPRLGMSYRRAWRLLDEVNGVFDAPVLWTRPGGPGGGGAGLTELGRAVVARYRSIERDATSATSDQLEWLTARARDDTA
jgi:molybdate transport system regulatory protein